MINNTELNEKLQKALTEYVLDEGGGIGISRIEEALVVLKEVHNKLIDRATEILAKKKV